MCDLGLPCGKSDCPFTPRNAVETRRIESPYGLNVKKLDPRATIATIPRDADENDASSNQNCRAVSHVGIRGLASILRRYGPRRSKAQPLQR
jgi:hypothetical protein